MASKKQFKPPKSLAQCADLLYTTRQTRLQIEKQVEELKSQEAQLKERLIAELPKGEATGVAGRLARVSIEDKIAPQVDVEHNGWAKAWEWAKKNNVPELFQRRINASTVTERWERGEKVDGIIPVSFPFVHVNKV